MTVQIWIGKSRIAGKGLFAGQDIPQETIITRYNGTKDFQSPKRPRLGARECLYLLAQRPLRH